MIKTIYRELFSFAIRNSFYRNQKYLSTPASVIREDFDVFPTKNTQDVMRQFGLVFCKKTSGFSIMAQVIKTAPNAYSVAKKIDLKTKLTFFLRLKNTELLSFSEVAFKELSQGKAYYCHNLSNNADPRTDLRLSTQTAINASDDLMRLQSSNYTYEHNDLIGSALAKIISIDGNEVINPVSASQNNGKTNISFNLSPFPEGRYKLEISGLHKDEFYFAGNQSNIFCICELFFDGTQANYRILEPDFSLLSVRPQYVLRFQRRKTFWRYILNMQKALAAPTLEISDASTAFTMTLPKPTQAIFTSNTLIDLMEDPLLRGSPANHVKIILKDGATEKIGNMPIPSHSMIKEESNQFYSEITINI